MRAADYNPGSRDMRRDVPTIGTPEWARVRAFLDVLRYNALCDSGAYRIVTVPARSWAHPGNKGPTKVGRAIDLINSTRTE